MITFDCMKKIKDGRPPIIESVTDTDSGIVYEYSDFCFVKNQYGYTVARYVRGKYGEDGEDVLFIEDPESGDSCELVLASDWQGWSAGTTRDEIWRWFNQHYSKGLGGLL